MCRRVLFVSCLIAFASCVSAASAPFIKKCKADDSKCIKSSGQAVVQKFAAGMPEYGVETLDPLQYDHLDASSKQLKLLLNDITITGAKNTEIKKLTRTPGQIHLSVLCNLKLEGLYEIDGQLLVLPIKGKGPLHAVLKQVLINVDADIVDKVKDGKTYWDIKSVKHTYELQGKSELILENLFEGNEVLGRAAKELLNSSANDVIAEVGTPILKALITKAVKSIDHFFHRVPADELAIN